MNRRAQKLVRDLRRSQRAYLLLGGLWILAGLGYGGWAVLRFDPRAEVESHISFDRPVSSIGHVFQPYQPLIRVVRPQTEVESTLLRALQGTMKFSAGMMITLLRVFLAVIAVIMGLVCVTVVYERHRLLSLIELLDPEPVT